MFCSVRGGYVNFGGHDIAFYPKRGGDDESRLWWRIGSGCNLCLLDGSEYPFRIAYKPAHIYYQREQSEHSKG